MQCMRVVAGLLCVSIFAALAAPPVPRQSPEFVINFPGNKTGLLSNYKGKVVVLAFILTTCPHCQATCRILSKLHTELGPKGFQPVAVAINPMALMLVPDFINEHKINFPVGASERGPALSYLQVSEMERWVVPQVVLIDRQGMIRAQTPATGDEKMQEENSLRQQIEALLGNGASTTKRGATTARKRTT